MPKTTIEINGEKITVDKTYVRPVKYADQYLKRKFLDWSDAELETERRLCMQDASMIKAEIDRRARIKR